MKSPYLLRDGDVLTIGTYVILVRLSQAAGFAAPPVAANNPWGGDDEEDIWGAGRPSPAPPMNRRDFQPPAVGLRQGAGQRVAARIEMRRDRADQFAGPLGCGFQLRPRLGWLQQSLQYPGTGAGMHAD